MARTLACHAGARQRFRGRGMFIRATSGPLSGYWIEEAPGHAYLRGAVVPLDYDPARQLTLAAGRAYTALQLGDSGAVHHPDDPARRSRDDAPRQPRRGRQRLCRRSASRTGALKGYWIKLQKGVEAALASYLPRNTMMLPV